MPRNEPKLQLARVFSQINLRAWSFSVTQRAISSAELVAAEPVVRVPVGEACGDLLELFREVTDGRSDQGRDHPVAAVLTLAATATVAGMKGYRAIVG